MSFRVFRLLEHCYVCDSRSVYWMMTTNIQMIGYPLDTLALGQLVNLYNTLCRVPGAFCIQKNSTISLGKCVCYIMLFDKICVRVLMEQNYNRSMQWVVTRATTGRNLLAPESRFNIKAVFPGMGIPIITTIKIRRSWDCLIFTLVRPRLYIELLMWISSCSLYAV